MPDIDDRLKRILLSNTRLEMDAGELGDGFDLLNGLALDSILIVNLLADLEEEFGIEIDSAPVDTPILSDYRLLKEFVEGRIAASVPSGGRAVD